MRVGVEVEPYNGELFYSHKMSVYDVSPDELK